MGPTIHSSGHHEESDGYQGAAFYRQKPAVRSGNLITASAMRPLEFAKEVFAALDVYTDEVLAAWYGLYKTGDAKYFEAFMKAAA